MRRDIRQLKKLLNGLDVPECGCPLILPCKLHRGDKCDCPIQLAPPCIHLFAIFRQHGMTLEEWLAKLRKITPQDYKNPRKPRKPMMLLDRELRIQIMTDRESRGEALFVPGFDLEAGSVAKIGKLAKSSRNGRFQSGPLQLCSTE